MQSMSIRCCSATLFSLFTLRWRAVNIFFFWSKWTPHFLFSSNNASLVAPLVSPGCRFVCLGWYREVLQLFTQYNDRLFGQEGVLRRSGVEVRGGRSTVDEELLGSVESRGVGGAVKDVSGLFEEREDEGETVRVKLAGRGERSERETPGQRTSTPYNSSNSSLSPPSESMALCLLSTRPFGKRQSRIDSGRFMIVSLSTVNRFPRRSSWRRVKSWG
jgi:hypothetical protein